MAVIPAPSVSQGPGEVVYSELANLGITPTSKGAGELNALLAASASNGSAVGGFNLGPNSTTASTLAATIARPAVSSATVTLAATGVLQMNAIYLMQGQVISNMNWVSGTTAASGPTNQWMAICNGPNALVTGPSNVGSPFYAPYAAAAYAYLAVSSNATSTAIGGSALFTYPVTTTILNPTSTSSTTFTVPATGLYYAVLMITTSTTQPTATGITQAFTHVSTLPPILAGTSGSGFTTPPVPGTTAAPSAPTPAGTIPYMYFN
jgi:hypothetical protein